jgi:hypothetical protein
LLAVFNVAATPAPPSRERVATLKLLDDTSGAMHEKWVPMLVWKHFPAFRKTKDLVDDLIAIGVKSK